jgi:hypothetical protein
MNPPTELQFVQLTGRSFEEHLEEGIKPIEQTLWSQHVFAVLQLLCYSRHSSLVFYSFVIWQQGVQAGTKETTNMVLSKQVI